MRLLTAIGVGLVLLAGLPAGAHAALPGLDRQTTTLGCPLGFALLPGTICPPADQISPDEAERDTTPRPPGAPIRSVASPYSAHSMIYTCCTPGPQMERSFAAARASGAGFVRLDVNLRGIFTARQGRPRRPDWRGVDRVAAVARRYQVPVLAVLTHVPDHITRCITDHRTSCAAGDVESYGRYAALIAARLEGVANHFEIVNEPDGKWAFRGSPQEYARMLEAADRHIKTRLPRARVLLGGLMKEDRSWMNRMLSTPGASAIRKFDIANVHVRGRVRDLPGVIRRWRAFFARWGFRGPLWVTEHGYPATRTFQYDRAYRGGEDAQAAYLERSLPALRQAGAAQVFVTQRDSWPDEFVGEFASEGILSLGQRAPFSVRRKPAFGVVTTMNRRWRTAMRLSASRRSHLRAARRLRRAGRGAAARRHERLARRDTVRLRGVGEF